MFWGLLAAPLAKNLPAMRETWVRTLGWEDSPGDRKGYPLQYSGLENSVDCKVHAVTNIHFTSTSYQCVVQPYNKEKTFPL